MRKCWTHNSRVDQAAVPVGSGAWPESHRLAWQRTAHRGPPVCRAPEGTEEPDHGARDRQRDPRVTAITTSAKVAHNFPRSLFETARKRCNSNDTNSMFEQAAEELRAKLTGRRRDLARCRWAAAGPGPDEFRMQFPHDTNRRTPKNRRISTIRLQYLKYTQGNCMRNYRDAVRTQHPTTRTATSTNNMARPRPVSRPRPRHSLSAAHQSDTARNSASDQAVMSTWSSTAARPASRRATGTRNGEQDT